MSILLSVPAQEWMWTDSAVALIRVATAAPTGSQFHFDTGTHSIAAKRNGAIELAFDHGLSHVLFCDSDMRPDPKHLQALIERDIALVSGLCFTRNPPYRPACMPKDTNIIRVGKGLISAEWTGMAFTLINISCLETMERPWFRHTEPGRGEDVDFCHRFPHSIAVDCNVLVPHIGVVGVTARNAKYLSQWTE